jgi:hypothetical protein
MNAYKDMLDNMVSPITCVSMKHQNLLEQMANGAMFVTHAQRKLARLAACAAPVRPMACAGQIGDTGQTGGQHRSGRLLQKPHNGTTSIPESLSDFSRPWNKNTLKTQLARKENPTPSLSKQLQIDQELTSSTETQRHTSQAVHPRQIPQEACTGQTGQAYGKNNQRTRFKSMFKFNYHVRVQAALDREHG